MSYKIILIIFSIVQLTVAACFGQEQKFSCNYSNQADPTVNSKACAYNGMNTYSVTDTLAKTLITMILNLEGLPLINFGIGPCDGINTCRAYIYSNGIRYIFYDRNFINKLLEKDEKDWRFLGILSHELFHQFDGSTLQKDADYSIRRAHELKADEFAGAILARLGADTAQAIVSLLSVEHPDCGNEKNNAYPCFEDRKKAVLQGYKSIHIRGGGQNVSLRKRLNETNVDPLENPVKHRESNDGSGLGVSIAYAIESEIKTRYSYLAQVSPDHIYNSVGRREFSDAFIVNALERVKTKGAPEESIRPKERGSNQGKNLATDTTSNRYRIKDYFKLNKINVDTFKSILNQKRTIIAAIRITKDFLKDSTGKWYLKKGYHFYGMRALCIVGYDENSRLFKFKNAMGANWGDNGYGYLRYADIKKLVAGAYYIDM